MDTDNKCTVILCKPERLAGTQSQGSVSLNNKLRVKAFQSTAIFPIRSPGYNSSNKKKISAIAALSSDVWIRIKILKTTMQMVFNVQQEYSLLIHLAFGSWILKSFLKRSPTDTLPFSARRSSSPEKITHNNTQSVLASYMFHLEKIWSDNIQYSAWADWHKGDV